MSKTRFLRLFVVGLLLTMSGCSGGCSNQQQEGKDPTRELPQSDPLVMVVKDQSDTTSTSTAYNLTRSFRYTKIPFTTHDLELAAGELSIPESVRLICVATSEIEQLSDRDIEKLVRFVSAGNALFTTVPVWDQRYGYLLGIKPGANYHIEPNADGFVFNELAFPGFKDGRFAQPVPYYHRGFDKEMFKPGIQVIAASKDSIKAPVITEYNVGRGTSVLFNSQIGFEKSYRGILFSTALRMLDGVAYPVANTSTIFLDDFPAPLYQKKMPPIDWEYDITHAEFVIKKWWPDMKQLANQYNIDYSAMIAFNYNANVVPPFDFEEWKLSKMNIPGEEDGGSIGLAEDVAQSRHELAFHGYNHFSLWLKDWDNEEFMISALQAARKRWRIDNLGPLPVTYVPPTNLIDSTGIQALVKAMPQIKYMSSLYIGAQENGMGREFSSDPYNSHLFDYPRITSGFVADKNSVFKQQSLYLVTGIWTHFIHPDDVFQVEQSPEDIFPSRNELGLGWQTSKNYDYGLYDVFKKRIEKTIQDYPFIRFMAAKDAAPLVQDWTQAQVYRTHQAGGRQVVYNLNAIQQGGAGAGSPDYWFMYIHRDNRDQIEQALAGQTEQLVFTPYWDGFLAQFATHQDTLNIPDLYRQRLNSDEQAIKNGVASYRNYLIVQQNGADSTTTWSDTRLKDALARLNENPGSRAFQDSVIDLAVEFSRLELAISLLEKRLLTSENWRGNDVKRLVTYYGWASQIDRAWSFLEKLWSRHQSQSVISLKERMVRRYGAPGPEFRDRWLKRELQLKPHDEQVLTQLVLSNQGKEHWPQARDYLKQLLQQNPASDTLYYYGLRRSFWYSPPDSTIDWLEDFPESSNQQLAPLADQIANLYAYTGEDYDQALQWAARTDSIATQTRLLWLQQAGRTAQFREQAISAVGSHPQNDSLRAFVGSELMYGGNTDRGYEILYPLFERNEAPAEVEKLIHTEIGYQPYAQKKNLYRQYPAFFSELQERELKHAYRTNQGVVGGLTGSYSSDNFGNDLGRIGLLAEWGNRQRYYHMATAGREWIQSDVRGRSLSDQLTSLNYSYRHNYRNQTMQLMVGGGVSTANGEYFPELKAGFWVAGSSSYSSTELSYSPVLTNTAISQDIDRLRGAFYREDNWLSKQRLLTTLSGTANWYTDDVFSYEILGRIYGKLPFSGTRFRSRLIAEGALMDATKSYSSGVPYWTPDDLFIKGGGVDLRYQTAAEEPKFRIEAELMLKHDKDGFYVASGARLYARINRYWELAIDGNISSSEIYRYNNVGLSLRYIFPEELSAKQ